MSKNKFEIYGDIITIKHPEWDFLAHASIRDDYIDEIQSVTWSKNGEYLYNKKLGYLHIYIMKKWYGEEKYLQMSRAGYVIDHMDNNGHNCCINNLFFLTSDENKAKGLTVDKMSKKRTHMALSLYKDFETGYFQITIVFNYPAIAKIEGLERPAKIDLACLLYDCEYELVLNDARKILYDYRRDYTFEPERLHDIDFHIEGAYGTPCSIESYDKYMEGNHGHTVFYFNRKAPIPNWTLSNKREFFHLREI